MEVKSSKRLLELDSLRGIAAILVVFFHIQYMHHLVHAGEISYSTYLVHPLIVGMAKPIYEMIYSSFNNNTLSLLISCIITLAVVLVVASLTYKYIEKPCMNWGKKFIVRETNTTV